MYEYEIKTAQMRQLSKRKAADFYCKYDAYEPRGNALLVSLHLYYTNIFFDTKVL